MIDAVTASYYLIFVQLFVHWSLRESSYDKGGMKILRGRLRKFLDTRKGGSEKLGRGLRKFVYLKTNRREGGGT